MGFCCEATDNLHGSTPKGVGGLHVDYHCYDMLVAFCGPLPAFG